MKRAILLSAKDTVATALQAVLAGENVEVADRQNRICDRLTARSPIPQGHKIALREMAAGEKIIKYGQVIGQSSAPIHRGDWVHTHNMESLRGRGDLV